jgi:hypothetical protein
MAKKFLSPFRLNYRWGLIYISPTKGGKRNVGAYLINIRLIWLTMFLENPYFPVVQNL